MDATLTEERVCSKCGIPKPLADFEWDDGLLKGHGSRCALCRSRKRNCPDCLELQSRPYNRRSAQRPRCEACRELRRPPGVPKERYRIRRHAIARFHERMRPDIAFYNEALWEMIRLMETAEWTLEPPPWFNSAAKYEGHDSFQRGWLHVAPGAAFTLSAYGDRVMVSTVMTGPEYELPEPVEPQPPWVESIHRTDAANHAAAEANREAMRERAREHASLRKRRALTSE